MRDGISRVSCFVAALTTTGVFAGSANALATSFVEEDDAGSTIPTAIVIGPEFDEVLGSLNSDHDLWGFEVVVAQDVQILLFDSQFDDNLLLFDSLGRGLAGNDDIGRGSASPGTDLPPGVQGLDSEIVAFLEPGLYYVGVGQNNSSGIDSNGDRVVDNDSGLLDTPSIRTLETLAGSEGSGSYTLAINRVVPEPTSAGLLALGVIGLAARRRR